MRLSTLEIKGFKSFADKTTLHFNQDVTGVVGPNGCGKSNIVDAIRWVLGETKSSNLRTEKMENLVFNGTKKRKMSGLAEVSLTFENTKNILPTEYATVTISRHYYRTGESEYRLNNVPCRLKDIRSLFLDTGVSSDSYAIIELNMLSDLLNDKDNSRRKMFEQASGISKYKIRKRETLLKLKNTQLDLDRVQDLLFEIENNLKELEKQARKARRFQKMKEDYKGFSIEMAIRLLGEQKDTYTTITQQQESETDKRLSIEADLKKLEAEIEVAKTGNISEEKALAEQQKEVNSLLSALQQQENDKNLLAERSRFLEERLENLNQAIRNAEQSMIQNEQDRKSLDKQAKAEQASIAHIQSQLEQLNKDLSKVKEIHLEAKEKLETEQTELKTAEGLIVEEEKRFEINQVKIENYRREIRQMSEEESAQSGQLGTWTEEEKTFEQLRSAAATDLDKLQQHADELEVKIAENRTTTDEAAEKLAGISRKLDSSNNEYRLTKNMIENLEGFPESVRYLRKEVSWTKNAPLLSDIIVCDDAYKAAIESYLQPWLNYYILPDVDAAVQSIEQLSDKEKGRANFFILSEVEQAATSNHDLPNGMRWANAVVKSDTPYSALLTHLLGKVVIFDDMQGGSPDWAFLKREKLNMISASGKYSKAQNSLSGGSVGLFKGKNLGRAHNLKELEAAVTSLEKEAAAAEATVDALRATHQQLLQGLDKAALRAAAAELEEADRKLLTCRAKMSNLRQLMEGKTGKSEELEKLIGELDSANQKLEKSLSDRYASCEAMVRSVEKKEDEFNALNNQLSIATNNYNQQHIRFHQQQNNVNSITQKLNFKIQLMEDTQVQQKKDQSQLTGTTEEIGTIKERLVTIEEELVKAYANKEVKEKALQQAEEVYFQARSAISELEDKLRSMQKNKEASNEVIGAIKDKMNELKLQLNSIKERLMIEFQIDIDTIIDQESTMEIPTEELNAKVDKMKHRLDNYGEINPMAVSAYDEMKVRYDFINEQKADLEEAKASLMETIGEIDETAKEKFMTAFDQVRENFIQTFRTLFREEDDCDLVLQDPDSPLESRIEIMAKPKGKRPQVIDQLSGGEKTLTAMALLFGLYLLKPAPFCVLDEVDAPLDDSNISKFNNIIRKFSDNSQFIIVTHNKRTMSHVDSIYGVTMQEAGISKVVPVDFSSFN